MDLPPARFAHTQTMVSRIVPAVLLCFAFASGSIALGAATNRLAFDSLPHARFEFTGPVGERIHANLDNWLLRAPQANPGRLEMFRVRDCQPVLPARLTCATDTPNFCA